MPRERNVVRPLLCALAIATVALGCADSRERTEDNSARQDRGGYLAPGQLRAARRRSVAVPPPPLVTADPGRVGPAQPENVVVISAASSGSTN